MGVSRSTPDDSLKVGVGGQHYALHSIEVADEVSLSPPVLGPPPLPIDFPKRRRAGKGRLEGLRSYQFFRFESVEYPRRKTPQASRYREVDRQTK